MPGSRSSALDFLWAKSVLLTTPLIASIGLSLTIPLALVLDYILHGTPFTVWYVLGGLCVLGGFVLVNVAHSREVAAQTNEQSSAEEESIQVQGSARWASVPATPATEPLTPHAGHLRLDELHGGSGSGGGRSSDADADVEKQRLR